MSLFMSITSYIDSYSSILIFELSDEDYCIQISELKGILNANDKEYSIENSLSNPVIVFKNTIYPFIDLTSVLKLKKKKFDKNSRILLIDYAKGVASIRVNQVKEILNIEKKIIEDLIKNGDESKLIRGKLKIDGKTLIMLNFNEILPVKENK
ncbi:MAG: chemotaxis protein CheW [Syntrophothermus sp.]